MPDAYREVSKEDEEMQVGKVVELISDDPGSKEDGPAWAQRTGNELAEMKQDGKTFTFYIKKKQA